jgi:DNA-directed RNA polymerase specialized sigma24 family protein
MSMSAETLDFESAWEQVRVPVWRYVRGRIYNQDDAEDVHGEVFLRTFRSPYPTESTEALLRWTITIAKNEVLRYQAKSGRKQRRETTLDWDLPEASSLGPDDPLQTWIALVGKAKDDGRISPLQASVLACRLLEPEESWDEIAAKIGQTKNNCAVSHFRAVRELAIFLFTECLEFVGGPEGAEQMLQDFGSELTVREREAFSVVIVKRRASYRAKEWRSALEQACMKLGRRLMARITGPV